MSHTAPKYDNIHRETNKSLSAQLLDQFTLIQQNRVRVYNDFERGFKKYLEEHDEKEYQELCARITSEFNSININIREIIGEMGKFHSNTASLINNIQEKEKRKLELTIGMQRLKQKYLIELEDAQFDPEYERQIESMKKEMVQVINDINEILEEIRYVKSELVSDLYEDEI